MTSITAHATPLMAVVIRAGKIPGLSLDDLVRAAERQEETGLVQRIKFPVVFCENCEPATQLVRDWFLVNPMAPKLLCLFCAILHAKRGIRVHTLAGSEDLDGFPVVDQ